MSANGATLGGDQLGRKRLMAGVPRVALSRAEAAEALGMSVDSFERYCQPEVRMIRRGRLRLVPLTELQAWAERNAERPLAEEMAE